MLEFEVFRKQMYCIEESTCDIVCFLAPPQSFGAPRSDSAPGHFASLAPLVTPLRRATMGAFASPPEISKHCIEF